MAPSGEYTAHKDTHALMDPDNPSSAASQPEWPLAGFSRIVLGAASLLLVCFGVFVRYADEAEQDVEEMYSYFIHVSIMIFIGFGFLMTFLKRYSMGAVALNFGLSVLVMLEAVLVFGAVEQWPRADFTQGPQFIQLNVELLTQGLFASGAAMISYGALIGKASPAQLALLLLLEVPLYVLNDALCIERLYGGMGATDAGGSLGIHAFGAYFGLAATYRLYSNKPSVGAEHRKNGAEYANDITSMVGTLFLWILWPSFNAAIAGPARFTAVCNTVVSISAATVATFGLSPLLTHEGKLDMVLIQNATLAGGVGIGSAVVLPVTPGGALLVGLCAGTLSSVGFTKIGPFLEARIGLRDTCGVHSLHGMPGVLGGLVATITLGAMGEGGRAGAEALALLTTLAIAVLGGLLCATVVGTIDAVPEAVLEALAFEDAAAFVTEPPPGDAPAPSAAGGAAKAS